MSWPSAKKLTVLLLLVSLAGCGGDSETSTTSATSAEGAATLLLQKSDLPPGIASEDSPPEPCSPRTYLEEQGAEVAITPLYKTASEDEAVVEAVGIVPSLKKAQLTLAELEAEKRIECIGGAIETFGPREGVRVEYANPAPVDQGDEGSLIRFREVDQASKPLNGTAVVSFRSGRCIASLLFVFQGGDSQMAVVNQVSARAEERLKSAQGTCR